MISQQTKISNSISDAAVPGNHDAKALDDGREKKKDPKSFSQAFFDTAAMRLLQLANNQMGSSLSIQGTTYKSSGLANHGVNISGDAGHLSILGTDNMEKKDQITQLSLIDRTDRSSHSQKMQDAPIDAEQTSKVNITGTSNAKAQSDLQLLRSECELILFLGESTPTYVPRSMINRQCLPLESDIGLYAVHAKTAFARFTHSNIKFLAMYMDRNHPGLFKKHLLRKFGRTDTPLPAFACTGTHGEWHGDSGPQSLDYFCNQSIMYVFSSSDAILQSFVSHTGKRFSSLGVWSDDLSRMVDSFRLLHTLDFQPANIFPSLWETAGKLFVTRTTPASLRLKKRTSSQPTSPGLSESEELLDDAEAAHIAKVILAALVGYTAEGTAETLRAVRTLRASGQIAPASTPADYPARKTLSECMIMIDQFEDEMALTLVTRLMKALATRKYLAGSAHHRALKEPRNNKQTCAVPDIMTLVVRNVVIPQAMPMNAVKILSRPSIKGATLLAFSELGWEKDGVDVDARVFLLWSEPQTKVLELVIEWLRSVLIKEWDGKAEVPKCSAVGGALELMSSICEFRSVTSLCIYARRADVLGDPFCGANTVSKQVFHTPFIATKMDVMKTPLEWLHAQEDHNTVHLLSYPFLFPTSTLFSFFRAINYSTMYKAFETSLITSKLAQQMTFTDPRTGRGQPRLEDRLKVATASYLVLEIRREHVLQDAMNQLWRRQKRELERPLKVRLGMQEGEEGVDHGGVQQEFFRLAIAEALDPKYGAFTTDPVTRMSWFQPRSLEPLYKFELLGMLVSLAVYNGLTLGFTFPIAFYRKLLNLEVDKVELIKDGWPELAKGLRALQAWSDGDVADTFMRSYVFSVDVFGTTVNFDMDAPRREGTEGLAKAATDVHRSETAKFALKAEETQPSKVAIGEGKVVDPASMAENEHLSNEAKGIGKAIDPMSKWENEHSAAKAREGNNEDGASSEPPMVTNANRNQYIRDYVDYLVNLSIAPQYEAFAEGFRTCLSSKSLSLFSPDSLQVLVEGWPFINTHHLEEITRYEGGYHLRHRTIQDFWRVVHSWGDAGDAEGRRLVMKLVEFVTASDRVPLGGMDRMTFVVQKNGVGNERLPTSLTCFGRLLLPEYSDLQWMASRLTKAVENSTGFGQP